MEINPPASIALFGFEPTPAKVHLAPRTRRWRFFRAGRALLATALIAPLAALIPPHAPWALGAVAGGLVLARRGWRERFTLVAFQGSCPRCGSPLSLPTPTRLLEPHPIGCGDCRHESVLRVDLPELRVGLGAATAP